jgi:uncharacterized protein (TIGR03437 family)
MRNLIAIAAVCLALPLGLLGQIPVVPAGSVVNAASAAGTQPVTPLSLVSIFGSNLAADLAQADSIPLSTALGGVEVTFNGIAAPLLFVAPGQINAQLPGRLTGNTASLVVRRGNVSSAAVDVPLGPVSPGIFTTQFGVGQAIAINLDGSLAAPTGSLPGLATAPVPVGGIIQILATGLGEVDAPIADGANSLDRLRNNTTKPVVLVGGIEAEVLFSGLSPQFVGVNQVNVVIPDGVTPGNSVPLQMRSGGITTSNQVTIAVRAR